MELYRGLSQYTYRHASYRQGLSQPDIVLSIFWNGTDLPAPVSAVAEWRSGSVLGPYIHPVGLSDRGRGNPEVRGSKPRSAKSFLSKVTARIIIYEHDLLVLFYLAYFNNSR